MLQIEVFTFNPIQENTYVLFNEKGEAAIIDPGCYFTAEKEELNNYLINNGLKPVKLLNTHCHLDHVFGNKYVHEKFGLDLYIHSDEEKVLEFAPQSGLQWGMPFDNYKGPLHFLNDNDIVKLGDDELKVLLTPGHSPGSISFYCEKQGFVIGGDVLFKESIGRTDLPGGNFEILEKSIREKLYTLPDAVIVYNGHGPATTIGHEKKMNPFVKM